MNRLVWMMMLGVVLGMLLPILLDANWIGVWQRVGAVINVGSWRVKR